MPRPREDQKPVRTPQRRRLTDTFIRQVRAPEREPITFSDTDVPKLQLLVQPTGSRNLRVYYRFAGQPAYYTIGLIPVAEARKIALRVLVKVANDIDPAAERQAARRGDGSFAELADLWLEVSKTRNKSWAQARNLVERHALPKWAKLPAATITSDHVERMLAGIASTSTRRQTLAAVSAIFTWAVTRARPRILTSNPCAGVEWTETNSRARIASDSEIPKLLAAFNKAGMRGLVLKTILLTGQRPGEVRHMRREHIRDGWWELPGPEVEELGWPGTKNGEHHRVWLPQVVQKTVRELGDEPTGFVFTGARGRPVTPLDEDMREICKALRIVVPVTAHDLRRTHGSTVTRLKFGRDAMNRIQNHRERGVTDTYDRNEYHDEDKQLMEQVAQFLLGQPPTNVVVLRGFTPVA
jgi:integrase